MPSTAMWPQAVVFDLDGTLVDSAPEIRMAINAAFEPLGVPAFSLDAVRRMIGGGAVVALRRAAERSGVVLDEERESRALDRFLEVLATESLRGDGLYPGALDLLEALRRNGVALAICTNKADPVTHIAVRALGIAEYFGAVIGATDELAKKPDPSMLLAAVQRLGASPAAAVMIGDTHADIGAASAAGCTSIAVSYGYSQQSVHDLGADAVVDRLADVQAALERLGAIPR
jgi:phosphoglycolate phosphatase